MFGLLVLAVLAMACNNESHEEENVKTTPVSKEEKRPPIDSIIDATKDTVIQLSFPAGDSSVVVLGQLNRPDQHITVNVTVQNARQLTATVTPVDSLANIRFNRVISPDGKSNGPFGKEISLPVQQSGTYQFIIAHNLMAEGGLTKQFRLRVSIAR